MLATLEGICSGEGEPGDIAYLEELAVTIKVARCVVWGRQRLIRC